MAAVSQQIYPETPKIVGLLLQKYDSYLLVKMRLRLSCSQPQWLGYLSSSSSSSLCLATYGAADRFPFSH